MKRNQDAEERAKQIEEGARRLDKAMEEAGFQHKPTTMRIGN